MCTLLVAHRCLPGSPLVVAANRDELLARPASGPRIVEGDPRRLMPRDELAGGTWLGLNERGLFVGITNRAGRPPDPRLRSRGLLVAEALEAHSASELHGRLAYLDAASINPFHLMYADADAAFVTWNDGERVHQYAIPPGLHVVTERSLGADDRGRTERISALFAERVAGKPPTVEGLRELLVLHGPPDVPVAGSCVHADAIGYGTRSSLIYIAGPEPMAAWREGHPCEGPMQDIGLLVGRLLRN